MFLLKKILKRLQIVKYAERHIFLEKYLFTKEVKNGKRNSKTSY